MTTTQGSTSAKDTALNCHFSSTCMMSDEQVVTQASEGFLKLAMQMLCCKEIDQSVH